MRAVDEDWWTRILCGSEEGNLRAPSSDEKYIALPRVADPRVVVDSASKQAMRDAMQRFIENRAGAAAGLLSEGASRVFARRRADWTVASSSSTLREHLSELLGSDLRLSIAVGPPRPNLKPIVRCYEGSTLRAVAKMGPDPHTASMVANEGDWLEQFAKHPFDDFVTPELLHRGTFGSSELLVMVPFETQGSSSVSIDSIPLDYIRAFDARNTSDTVKASS